VEDLDYQDVRHGRVILTFDGHVLEVFSERTGNVCRLVVGMLFLRTEGPDRKGRYLVRVSVLRDLPGAGTILTIATVDWPAVEAWLARVNAAIT